ncbi:MAG: hypothetical protein P4L28_07755 [Paludibacteraceae bacterium]|nr:hypothetical protein [Paludibacteraceae bacterium]
METLKSFLILFLSITLTFCSSSSTHKKKIVLVTAEKYYNDYIDNGNKADSLYKDKEIYITGIADTFTTECVGNLCVTSLLIYAVNCDSILYYISHKEKYKDIGNIEDWMPKVTVDFPDSVNWLHDTFAKPHQKITIKGIGNGRVNADVFVKDSRLIKVY